MEPILFTLLLLPGLLTAAFTGVFAKKTNAALHERRAARLAARATTVS